MKKWLALTLTGIFLLGANTTVLAKGPTNKGPMVKGQAQTKVQENVKVNNVQGNKNVATDKKAEIQEAKSQREELRVLINQIRGEHQETIALMKEIQAKRKTIIKYVNAIKDDNETSGDGTETTTTPTTTTPTTTTTTTTTTAQTTTNQVSADVQSAIKIMSTIKGLGVKNKGLWGQYNQARKNKDIEQAKSILQQISDNIAAQNEQLKQISATLDGIIVDLGA